MGWKGDQWCWFCHADLYRIRDQQEGRDFDFIQFDNGWLLGPDPRSFEWHMNGLCMVEGYWVEIIDGAELTVRSRSYDLVE